MSNDDLTQTPLAADGAFEVHLANVARSTVYLPTSLS
jgi:hypothetical protein